MKKPQLYIKNSKGRYEPYQEPQPEPDHNIYRRYGKKYEPVGVCDPHTGIGDGIWLVRHKEGSTRMANIDHYAHKWGLTKLAPLPVTDITQFAALEEINETIDKFLYQKFGFTIGNIPHQDLAEEITKLIASLSKQ